MLGRFKNRIVALGLLVLPIYSVRSMSLRSMLDRFKNPVVALELSKRYTSKAYVIVVYAVYAVYSFSAFDRAVVLANNDRPHLDVDVLVDFVIWPVIVVIFLVVPVLTAVSVVGERRRGTLMLVQLSSLRPFDIVWGKVVASVAPVLFPIVVYLVVSVSFSLFSFSLLLMNNGDEMIVHLLFASGFQVPAIVSVGLVMLSVAVSVVCVLCSTFAKSSASAIAMSYGLFFWVILPVPFVWELIEPVVWELIEVSPTPIRDRLMLIGSRHLRSGFMVYTAMVGFVACVVGLPFCCLRACRRLRLLAEKVEVV